jgi:hypothetical protein
MTSADLYRVKAAECDALSHSEPSPVVRTELQALAKAYRRLAELADRNSQRDIFYEPPFVRPQQGNHVPQQQQQIQPKPDEGEQ